ncbi:MAG: hypothetical protein KBT61_09200 [Paraperlucidibaca sp.]|nr:hypothetical protein [Paraperlucidibaca sp.]MBQ0722696.1 hypothetical protein [Paraperlucidibaca sp.]MBQ0843126.1 hypothetical protein [Paraperlucidibaca sp.]
MSRSHKSDERLTLSDLFHRYQALYDLARPIVIFNSDMMDINAYILPPELLEAAGESPENIQRVIASSDELALMSLDPYQINDFNSGIPILLRAVRFEHREKCESGGQINDKLEKEIKIALACTVYNGIERMRHLFFIRDKIVYPSKDASREVIIQQLATLWARNKFKEIDEVRNRKHLNTLWSKGKRSECWKHFFAADNLAHDIKNWAKIFNKAKKKDIDYEINFQISLMRSLIYCESRATKLRKIMNTISDNTANNISESKNLRDNLAATTEDQKRSVSDVLPAAFCGDINPSDLFPSLENFRCQFNTMRAIGRYYRGLPADFTYDGMIILMDAFKIRAQWEIMTEEHKTKEQAFWVAVLDTVMSSDDWHRFYNEGYQATKNGERFSVQRIVNNKT